MDKSLFPKQYISADLKKDVLRLADSLNVKIQELEDELKNKKRSLPKPMRPYLPRTMR